MPSLLGLNYMFKVMAENLEKVSSNSTLSIPANVFRDAAVFCREVLENYEYSNPQEGIFYYRSMISAVEYEFGLVEGTKEIFYGCMIIVLLEQGLNLFWNPKNIESAKLMSQIFLRLSVMAENEICESFFANDSVE